MNQNKQIDTINTETCINDEMNKLQIRIIQGINKRSEIDLLKAARQTLDDYIIHLGKANE